MQGFRATSFRIAIVILPLVLLGLSNPAPAYVDLAPTLSKICTDAKKIALAEVVEWNQEKRILVLKEIRALKGELSSAPVRHQLASATVAIPRPILVWAAPGARCIVFSSRRTALVCVGEGWYQAQASRADSWKLAKDRPDLPLAYFGNISRLVDSLSLMLAGKHAVLTVVAHGADDEAGSFDLALNRHALPGLARVQRIRADRNMPPMVMAASANPAYLIGSGAVDEKDLGALLEKLQSSDALVRVEAIADLRSLGRKARSATAPLTPLLDDPAYRVRLSAASALLRLDPKTPRAGEVLARSLESRDPVERREAARAAGFTGAGAAPLVEKLAASLKDRDVATRITALQALSAFGPAAAPAVGALVPLLADPELAIDAADALGHIGPAARPALPRLTPMLSAQEVPVRWAAVRAMAQIGGQEAHPAVDFMVKVLPKATEVEAYNIMIYLSLLGPVASDAVPVIRRTRIKNPVLPSATLWAIAPAKTLPWMNGGFAMPGPGGPGGSMPDIAELIYEAYIHELGDRLRPAARLLAQKILEGKAGEVPLWGYRILTCAPDEALAILTPHLADRDLVMRERATVALGYMGPAARPGADAVKAAVGRAANDREKRLIVWCLKEITRK